ncbi:MAG: hypothetical protein LBN21_13000 [Treponema sp.]|nr:hypothetical protein [Treponema sp.]
MKILKKGIRFFSQDTGTPMLEAEIPSLILNLTRGGMYRAALVGLCAMHEKGLTISQVLNILDNKPKEKK